MSETAITTGWSELATNEGPMRAYVARPAGAPRGGPGMLVFQEAFGVNGHVRDVTERFARFGLTAIAPELFHRTAQGFEGSYTDFNAMRPHMAKLSTDGLAADAAVAFRALVDDEGVDAERVAAVGYCMGGRAAYIANANLPLRAAISFYGGGIAPDLLDLAGKQHGPILMFWGGRDAHITPELRRSVADALTAAKAAHEQVIFSEADHGFNCDVRASFHAQSSQQAWALVRAFLHAYGVLRD